MQKKLKSLEMNLYIALTTLETMLSYQISTDFDGAYSKAGKGAGIMIISPSNKIYNFAFRLYFEASNNVAEYEALLLGLETAKDMVIKMLNINTDSNLVVLQLKNQYQCKSDRLRKYRNAIWDTMEWFDALTFKRSLGK